MHLTAMMGLVLEEMRQKIIPTVVLGLVAPIHIDDFDQPVGGQALNMGQKGHILGLLPAGQGGKIGAGAGLIKRGAVQPVALQRVQVEAVDQKDMVQRGLDAAKEGGSWGHQFLGWKLGQGAMQSGIGQPVRLGQFAKGAKVVGHSGNPISRQKSMAGDLAGLATTGFFPGPPAPRQGRRLSQAGPGGKQARMAKAVVKARFNQPLPSWLAFTARLFLTCRPKRRFRSRASAGVSALT